MTRRLFPIAATLTLLLLLLARSSEGVDERAPKLKKAATFKVPPGFVVEQVAGPPLVEHPMMGCFDDQGRLYVAEAEDGEWEARSAGSKPAGFVHPFAVRVMKEMGVDLAQHESKSVDTFADESFDVVVTVCDHAKDACPTFPNAQLVLHWPFPDPADAVGTDDDKLAVFRTVRDQISNKIKDFLKHST